MLRGRAFFPSTISQTPAKHSAVLVNLEPNPVKAGGLPRAHDARGEATTPTGQGI